MSGETPAGTASLSGRFRLLAAGFMQLECLVCVYVFVQAVTVKEALSAKGRHIRRSLSTPNVQHVRPDLLFAHV